VPRVPSQSTELLPAKATRAVQKKLGKALSGHLAYLASETLLKAARGDRLMRPLVWDRGVILCN
jgi:hypothetical protein